MDKQAARKKYQASQNKKRRTGPRKSMKTKKQGYQGPKGSSLDQFIDVPVGQHDEKSLEHMMMMDNSSDPRTKDFGYLLGEWV